MEKKYNMINNNDFYEAKERLGLMSVGDPGSQNKLQVNDTFIVSLARRVDSKIKQHRKLKSMLIKSRNKIIAIKSLISNKKNIVSNKLITRKETNVKSLDINKLVKEISFKKVSNPQVSIVIPAFNKAEYTAYCLKSIYEKLGGGNPSFEVVLVDNGSTDNTTLLKAIKNLVYIHNRENLGFVGGCNSGFDKSRGEYVIFLNNDSEVTDNWLVSLYKTISSGDNIGLVGSKILYPDGRLQEAGGITFKDANGLNYGKFDDADSYQYNYLRDVDYCSGASIIISRKLMKKFNGFDALYNPAYYEDTDLAFKVRKEGLRVVYQPESIIYHIEGGTAGTSTSIGFKKYQLLNKEKFYNRWKKTLKLSHADEGDWYLGRDRSGDKLALVIEESVPTPDKDSGSVRMFAIIKGLQSLGYKVTFWPNSLKKNEPYVKNLQQIGVEVVYGSIDFMQFARLYGHLYNLVIMSRPEICARYINICKNLFTKAKLIYDTVDLHYVRLARQADIEAANANQLLEKSKWYELLEKGLMERVDATLVVSEKEVEILRSEGVPSEIDIVSNIHEIRPEAYMSKFISRKDIVFVGNYAHLPNQDSIKWFLEEIFPKVTDKLKNVKLHVVGANMPPELRKNIQGDNIIIDGFVSDKQLAELLTGSRVFVAPLRYGAGVKGKIGQAIEYGLPVVTTSIGSEGMFLEDRISCLESNDSDSFAVSITELYNNESLWNKLRDNARLSLVKNFSPEVAKNNLKKLLKI